MGGAEANDTLYPNGCGGRCAHRSRAGGWLDTEYQNGCGMLVSLGAEQIAYTVRALCSFPIASMTSEAGAAWGEAGGQWGDQTHVSERKEERRNQVHDARVEDDPSESSGTVGGQDDLHLPPSDAQRRIPFIEPPAVSRPPCI